MDRFDTGAKARRFAYPVVAVVAALFFLVGMSVASSLSLTRSAHADRPAAPVANGAPQSFADLVEVLGPSVVNVKVTKLQKTELPDMREFQEGPFGDMFKQFFGDMRQSPRQFKSRGAGSGVIIDSDGTVLTNNHVVDGASEITVTLSDKHEYKARVVGRDPKTDLAVIRIEAKGQFHAARLGDSDSLRVGEPVLAIGNPFGLSNTVTSGIVSAKGRVIGAGPYDDFIQTDAPINPGNSGGPLFNTRGEVVGITTAILPNGQGIGFAVPVNTATSLLPELVAKGTVTRGYLGVNIQTMTDDLAASLGLKSTKGALVSDVAAGSPAEKAGIKRGDVIVEFNGREVKDSHGLAAAVAATPVGKEATVVVMREGKRVGLKTTTGKLPSEQAPAGKSTEQPQGKWGLQLRDLNDDLAREMGLKRNQGVVVTGVRPGSPADEASVQTGDVILEVNRQPIKDAADVKAKIEKSATKSLLLLARRGENTVYIVLKGAIAP